MDSNLGCISVITKKIVSGICSEDLVIVSLLAAVATKSCINFIAVVFLSFLVAKKYCRPLHYVFQVIKANNCLGFKKGFPATRGDAQ